MMKNIPWRSFLAGAVLGAVIVIVVEHAHPAQLDDQMAALHQMLARDSVVHQATVARTDGALAHGATAAAAAVHADSGWDVARRLAATVPVVIASSAPDSSKIIALAHIVDTLVARGDSLRASNDSLRAALTHIQTAVLAERASAMRQLADYGTALETSEQETAAARRHLGLGCAAGPTALVSPSGAPMLGIGLTCGLSYRR